MMARLKSLALLTVLIAATQLCSCVSRILLNPCWKLDATSGKTCAIVLHPEKIRLSYLGSYEHLKADSVLMIKQNFMRCMKRQLRRNGYFSDAWFDDFAGTVRCTSMVVQSGYTVRMPYPDFPVTMAKRQPDYLLIFDSVTIRPRIEGPPGQDSAFGRDSAGGQKLDYTFPCNRTLAGFLPSLYLGTQSVAQFPFPTIPMGSTMPFPPFNPGQYFPSSPGWFSKGKTVRFRCQFILWDVKQRCAARWGVARGHGNEGFTMDDWSNFIDDIQKEIFSQMPFFNETCDYVKVLGPCDTLHVTGLRNRISLARKKVGWVVTNTIVNMGRQARENDAGARVGGALESHRSKRDTLLFMSTASRGEFSAPFFSALSARVSRLLPAQQPSRELMRRQLQDQLLDYFRYDNKPLDTLGDCVLAHAYEDSLDYLVVLYPLFTYPDTTDNIRKISDYDIRLFGSLYDVRNNMSLVDVREDFDNILDRTNVKGFGEAVRIFGSLVLYHLGAFLKF
jgi:hypothetical protein